VVDLWIEFIDHSGALIVAAAGLAAIYGASRAREAPGFFLAWCAIAAVAFSLVDWRHTKHLAHFLPALAILIAVYWAALKGRLRLAVGVLIGLGIAWNLWRVGLQMQDFNYIRPTPIW
jgi:hypothetical protein